MPIPKKEKTATKGRKFKVGNFEITIGEKYVLDNKYDGSAPSILQKIEATKFPFTGSGVNDCVYFDTKRNLYDTGFYEQSFCLERYKPEEITTYVPIYNELIRIPYENQTSNDLDQNRNNDFWKDYRYEATVNKEFDTEKPDELMELFQVIMQGVACDKNEKDPFYRQNAQYIISNPSLVKNKQKEKAKTRLRAIKTFAILVSSDRDKLNLVLQFAGKDNPAKVDDETLEQIYFDVFNDKEKGVSVAETFLETCDYYETLKGKEQMEFFYVVHQLLKLRKIQKTNRGYETLEGTYLGIDLKGITDFCLLENSTQFKAISTLIDENPSVRRQV